AFRHYAALRCRLLLVPPPVSRSPVTPFGHCMTSLRSGCCWPPAYSLQPTASGLKPQASSLRPPATLNFAVFWESLAMQSKNRHNGRL
ncbi:MAG: hypothetical protein FWD31_03985, partial [Planctomycetaceae bacterium]|nr:hypothetical protein [Planctomycetaceae bacterium]